MNPTLSDEILTINAIFTPFTLTLYPPYSSATPSSTQSCILHIPNHHVSLRLSFPQDYPDSTPTILGPASSGDSAETRKGEATEVAALAGDVLSSCFRAGEPCIYDLLVELEPLLETSSAVESTHTTDDAVSATTREASSTSETTKFKPPASDLIPPPAWSLSQPLTLQKSTFLARSLHLTSLHLVHASLTHLLSTDKRAARATHNISAWRIRDPATGATYQDYDDDGETAAGGRLLHLLQLVDAWDVLVVVSRWYGGVLLGPERFRCIGAVAREALVVGGFVVGEGEKGKGKGGKG